MLKELGKENARRLKTRLSDMSAAEFLADIVAGNPHLLKGKRSGEFALNLHGGKRLVFECADEPPPLDDGGCIRWNLVTKVRIVFIGDYHD